LEGAAGPFALERYRLGRFHSQYAESVDGLLKSNVITGAESMGLLALSAPQFWGVETPADYVANVRALRDAASLDGSFRRAITSLTTSAAAAKAREFSQSLRELDAALTDYDRGALDIASLVRALRRAAPTARHGEVDRLAGLLDRQESMDWPAVERDRSSLLRALANRLSAPALAELAAAAGAIRAGEGRFASFHRALATAAATHGLRLANYPAFERYAAYVSDAETLDKYALFDQLEALRGKAVSARARTSAERDVMAAAEDLRRLERLRTHAFGPADWDAYVRRRDDVRRLPERLGVAVPDFTALLDVFEAFYTAAERRNLSLAANLSERARATGARVSVLVAGGFHTPGLEAECRRAGASVVTLSPAVAALPENPAAYLDVFLSPAIPMERLLLKEKLHIAPDLRTAETPLLRGPISTSELPTPDASTNAMGFSSVLKSIPSALVLTAALWSTSFDVQAMGDAARLVGIYGFFVPLLLAGLGFLYANRASAKALWSRWTGKTIAPVAVQSVPTNEISERVIDRGLAYREGRLKTEPVQSVFRPSVADDVPMLSDVAPKDRRRLIARALVSLKQGRGVFSILAAGAASRMNTNEAPPEALALVRTLHGREDVVIKSKAAVPLGQTEKGRVLTYLGAYLTNIADLQAAVGDPARPNRVRILTNDEYADELDRELARQSNYGVTAEIAKPRQALGDQYVGTPADVEALKGKLGDHYDAALAAAKGVDAAVGTGDRSSVVLPDEKAPLGHGEYFHGMVSSGELLRLLDDGTEWVAVRNIDNSASLYDEEWLVELGLFLERGLDFQVEVSPRVAGQKGGAYIVTEKGAGVLTEGPSFDATWAAFAAERTAAGDRSLAVSEAKAVANRRIQSEGEVVLEPSRMDFRRTSMNVWTDIEPAIDGGRVVAFADGAGEAHFYGRVRPEDTHWFNTATAIFSPRYLYYVYRRDADQTFDAFVAELAAASPVEREAIADRGRGRFPVLVDPKPAKSSSAVAVKIETNMWQSTQVAAEAGATIGAVGVKSVLNISEKSSDAEFRGLRFLATKQWTGPVESYESNKPYVERILRRLVALRGELSTLAAASPSSTGQARSLLPLLWGAFFLSSYSPDAWSAVELFVGLAGSHAFLPLVGLVFVFLNTALAKSLLKPFTPKMLSQEADMALDPDFHPPVPAIDDPIAGYRHELIVSANLGLVSLGREQYYSRREARSLFQRAAFTIALRLAGAKEGTDNDASSMTLMNALLAAARHLDGEKFAAAVAAWFRESPVMTLVGLRAPFLDETQASVRVLVLEASSTPSTAVFEQGMKAQIRETVRRYAREDVQDDMKQRPDITQGLVVVITEEATLKDPLFTAEIASLAYNKIGLRIINDVTGGLSQVLEQDGGGSVLRLAPAVQTLGAPEAVQRIQVVTMPGSELRIDRAGFAEDVVQILVWLLTGIAAVRTEDIDRHLRALQETLTNA
jgi:hypothetical protein